MSSKLLDRARKTRQKEAPKVEANAPSEAESPVPTPEELDAIQGAPAPAPAPDPIEDDTRGDAEVIELASKLAERLSDAEVEAFIEARERAIPESTDPGVATMVATRITKLEQVQYDGKTPEGFIVRVWAPTGLPMVMAVELVTA